MTCVMAGFTLRQCCSAGLGADFVFRAGSTGDSKSSDQFAVHNDGQAALNRNGILQAKHEQSIAAPPQSFLKHLRRPLEDRRGLCLRDRNVHAADLSLIQLFQIDEMATWIYDR